MAKNAANMLVKALDAQGVSYVFGIPGTQTLELFDALAETDAKLVLVTHEASASFMADAIARSTGNIAVIAVVPGPGLTNAFTGIAEALLDSVPMLVIASTHRSGIKQKFQLHEIDQFAALKPIVKDIFKVDAPDDMGDMVMEAVKLALSGEPGPVAVEVPSDVFMESAKAKTANIGKIHIDTTLSPDAEKLLKEAAEVIRDSKQIGIYAGFGTFGATEELINLAERLSAPVASTITGRGTIPEDHPLSVGYGFGATGTPYAEEAFKKCDCILAVGCKFGEVPTGTYNLNLPEKLIHIDINPDVLNANFKAKVAICADAKEALKALNRELEDHTKDADTALVEKIGKARENYFSKLDKLKPSKDYVTPSKLVWELRKRCPRDTIITTDSGYHQFWVLSAWPVYEPRTYLTPVDYQSMGYGVPAAIAAKLAWPERRVIATVGDGGFLMTGMELVTAMREEIAPMVVIFNDGALGLIKQVQKRVYRRATAVDLVNPDYKKLAEAFGMRYQLIRNDEELKAGLDEAMKSPDGIIVDARVQYRDVNRFIYGSALGNMKLMAMKVQLRMAGRMAMRSVTELIK